MSRRSWWRLEPIHAVTYFAPEARAAHADAGLRGFWRGCFATRAAPFGRASAELVTATFFNFRPSMVARATMAAAAGAQMTATASKPHPSVGAIAMTGGGRPVPSDGGRWEGGLGFLTGDQMMRLLHRIYGSLFGVKWVHGFYGMPEQPFPPHVELDGQKWSSAADTPPGFWPGDHIGCNCAITPTVL